MPLELGVLLAWGKETFVTSARPFDTIKTISDLNFGDIHCHRERISELVRHLSRWAEQHCSHKRFRVSILMKRYRRLQRIRKSLGADFEKLTTSEISKLLGIVEEEFSMELHLPHAACADRGLDFVGTKSGAEREGHGGCPIMPDYTARVAHADWISRSTPPARCDRRTTGDIRAVLNGIVWDLS